MLYNRKQISIYTRYECLYTTVMVALNIYIGLHYFVALFNQMFKKCIVWNWNTTNLPVFLIVLLVYKSSMKQWLLGISKPNQTASAYRGLLEVESWKIPESAEVTMSMNWIEELSDRREERRKRERNPRNYCWLTVKNARNWQICFLRCHVQLQLVAPALALMFKTLNKQTRE